MGRRCFFFAITYLCTDLRNYVKVHVDDRWAEVSITKLTTSDESANYRTFHRHDLEGSVIGAVNGPKIWSYPFTTVVISGRTSASKNVQILLNAKI
uniref:NtCtMGAM_N domain-containing protein n=1 Tax=Ascaris lumbricoides TaxID=6252 RepID=A0A0M3I1H5_ASCLU